MLCILNSRFYDPQDFWVSTISIKSTVDANVTIKINTNKKCTDQTTLNYDLTEIYYVTYYDVIGNEKAETSFPDVGSVFCGHNIAVKVKPYDAPAFDYGVIVAVNGCRVPIGAWRLCHVHGSVKYSWRRRSLV